MFEFSFTCPSPVVFGPSASGDPTSRMDLDSPSQPAPTTQLQARPPPPPQQQLLDSASVELQLRHLNSLFPPVLPDDRLYNVVRDAQREIAHLLGRPLEEVFAEACATWSEILVKAKGRAEDIIPFWGKRRAIRELARATIVVGAYLDTYSRHGHPDTGPVSQPSQWTNCCAK